MAQYTNCGLVGVDPNNYSKLVHEMIAGYEYEVFNMRESKMRDYILHKNYLGMNIASPYKHIAFALCDDLTEDARATGCVNALRLCDDGRILGTNTELPGFLQMVNREQIEIAGKHVMILGSGSTADAVCTACKRIGAAEIIIVSRSGAVNYQNYFEHPAEILVNTTPVGMLPELDSMPVDPERIPGLSVVIDTVCNPLKTKLVQRAHALGMKSIGGIEMLIAQAVYSSRFFLQKNTEVAIDNQLFKDVKQKICNVVLIGMPGNGKTTIGMNVANFLNKDFVDVDEYIEDMIGMEIPDYVEQMGMTAYREVEEKVIHDLSARNNVVIAAGGGAVLSSVCMEKLRENGRIYYVERDLAHLSVHHPQLMEMLYEERRPYFEKYADATVVNRENSISVARDIMQDYFKTV